jgi:methyltransferase-like protein/2-polyprenyl-3-methyl-5-hydroxy-6-metoxy-1,4-benzoquinol methylase
MSANAYDAVPYASHAFPQSQPEQLAVLARLFGLQPALPSTARVLELGCAAGGNLVPLAARYPRARFVGIDYSAVEVAHGQELVRDMGLGNVELRHQSIADFGRSDEPFDYVVCHGVYSWVTPDLQDAILKLCRANLAPNGVAYVSYNTYPGWKMREIVRDTMMYHTRALQDPKQKLTQARAIVKLIQEATDPATAFGKMLADEAGLVGRAEDFYLFHEHLEANNRPCYFREFIERAAAHQLGYLGESNLADMAPQRLGAKVFEALQKLSGGNIIATEQYMDFFRNRSFRQTLLVHAERMSAVRRELTPASHRPFLLSFGLAPAAVTPPETAEPIEFRDAAGRSIRVVAPLLKAFLLALARRFPRPAGFEDVLAEARAALDGKLVVAEADVATLDAALSRFVLEGLLRLHLEPLAVGTAQDALPRSFAPARAAALRRQSTVATLRHESVRLNPIDARVLELLDGSHDHESLRQKLVSAAVRGELTVKKGEQAVVDPQTLQAAVGQLLSDSLRRFEKLALLEAA